MTGPKPGDRARVQYRTGGYKSTFVMPIVEVSEDGRFVAKQVCLDGVGNSPPETIEITVEILPPPEPEWQNGDIVIDADGEAFRLDHMCWIRIADSVLFRDMDVRRPLRRARIVPEDGAS